MEYQKCFGDKKNNKIKFYTDLGMPYELSKTMTHRICRACKFNDECCKKIINGNGFNGINKKGKVSKKDFVGYKNLSKIARLKNE